MNGCQRDELVERVFDAWESYLTHCSPEPDLDAMVYVGVPIREMPEEEYRELRERLLEKQERFWREVERLGYLQIEYICPECGLSTEREVTYQAIVDEQRLEFPCERCGGIAYVQFRAGAFHVW